MKKHFALVITLILVAALLFGCGAESGAMKDMAGALPEENMDGTHLSGNTNTGSLPQSDNQKLVRKVRMEAETEELDSLLSAIDQKIADLSGYVEAREVYNGSQYSGRRYRSATMTVRIPVDRMDSFVTHVKENSNIVSSNETVDNITLTYVATQSRITALETEQTRLLELLAQAENMEDLLTIEKRLTEVRTELEEYTSQIRLYDNMVDYATITLNINEVREYSVPEEEPKTVWERIGTGFVKSLKGLGNFFVELFVFVIVASPYLLLIGGIAFGMIFLCRRKKAKKQKEEETK